MPVKLSSSDDAHEEDARIEIIPLIDIMFFLLASFMLVSLSMTHLHRVPVDLPKAASAITDTREPPVTVAVDKNGLVYVDKELVTLTDLPVKLAQHKKPGDELRVLIAGDADVRHQQILAVLDAVRAAGVDKVSFETKPWKP
jgi:biopolymer transport protein ExbD